MRADATRETIHRDAARQYEAISERASELEGMPSESVPVFELPILTSSSQQEAEEQLQTWIVESAQEHAVELVLFSAAPIEKFETIDRVAMRFEGRAVLSDLYAFLDSVRTHNEQGIGLSRLSIRRDNRARDTLDVSFELLAWVFYERQP